MKKLLIIKNGRSFRSVVAKLGDFENWIVNGLGLEISQVAVVDMPGGGHLPEPGDFGGVIITGSHAMVTDDLPWSVTIEKWVPGVIDKEIPLLGICYGHQLLAKAMGGVADYHPKGTEVGTVDINCLAAAKDDPLFRDMPPVFHAHVSHSQSVITLPKDAVLLAENSFERHHAFRIAACAWGVQFHPEYTVDVMNAYIEKNGITH